MIISLQSCPSNHFLPHPFLARLAFLIMTNSNRTTYCSIPNESKVDIMAEIINTFEPVVGTIIHVLLDSWYASKRIWKIARERGFLITSGLHCNRSLRIEDPGAPQGWRWQRVDEYAAALSQEEWQGSVGPA